MNAPATPPRIALISCAVFQSELAVHGAGRANIVVRKEFEIELHDRPDLLRSSLQGVVGELLQAKAAIGAGIETLLASAGMRVDELDRIYLAGGFGLHLNPTNAAAIGLLPAMPMEKIRVVGNSSLAGAHLALLDRSLWAGLEALRDKATVVELNSDPNFEDRYIDHLSLP